MERDRVTEINQYTLYAVFIIGRDSVMAAEINWFSSSGLCIMERDEVTEINGIHSIVYV
jgi:hypothetical protein